MRYKSYTDAVSQLVADGEEINVVHVGGFAWTGAVVDIGPDLIRLRSEKKHSLGKATEHLINPAHVAGINVEAREA